MNMHPADPGFPMSWGFGDRLHTAMWRARLTSPKLAKLMGVSDQTVRNWQDGTHQPSDAVVLMLAVVLGVPVESLDPKHPLAGIVWSFDGPGPGGGWYAPRDSNPEPSGRRSGWGAEVVAFPIARRRAEAA